MTNVLLLNIGNTHAEAAAWNGKSMSGKKRFQTAGLPRDDQFQAALQQSSGNPIVIACVVPGMRAWLEEILAAANLFWVSASMDTGVDFSLVNASTLGADRVANAVAAVHDLPLPTIVLDCGTAITTQVVDAQRRFLGGSIAPGRILARRALAEQTGQLPFVELSDDLPPPLGRTTNEAIRAGVDLGLVGAVDRQLDELRRHLGNPTLAAVAVGGDRDYFARYANNVIAGPDDFTLRGLAWIAKRLIDDW